MLSNSRGPQRGAGLLNFRKDTITELSTPCPMLKKRGKCAAHNKEVEARRQISREKEAELLKKATTMYKLQQELLEDGDAEMRELAGEACGTALTEQEAIGKFIAELRQEPAYLQWNLEAAVEERLVYLGVRRCRYAHRLEVSSAVKRGRLEAAQEDSRVLKAEETATGQRSAQVCRGTAADAKITAAWEAERQRIFGAFTPLQKCVVCLVWQRVVEVRRDVLGDVRGEMARKAEEQFYNRQPTTGSGHRTSAEHELESYLESAEFAEAVEAESKRIVSHSVCRPLLGVFDLSSLPRLITYISNHPRERIITQDTCGFFVGSQKAHMSLVQRNLTEKELDVSAPARAEELVEALEWVLHVFSRERRLGRLPHGDDEEDAAYVASSAEKAAHTHALFRTGRVVVRSLVMKECGITSADGLVTSLRKHGMENTLLALDLSRNRLSSLRFLFILRAHFSTRLLRLSLRDNLITCKPEYQEQVRLSLPRLTSLDGEPIRRPPLAFAKPLPTSSSLLRTARAHDLEQASGASLTAAELSTVMDCVSRLLYILETGHIPHTALECEAFAREASGGGRPHRDAAAAVTVASGEALCSVLPPEEEADEDNFPHRYLHPSALFSFTVVPGLTLLDPATMRLNREVEMDDSYQGMRLNPGDLKDMRVFDVAMKNSSRNLLFGRPAVRRVVRGATDCHLAYQLTLYPECMEVEHHLAGAVISVVKVPGSPPQRADTPSTKHKQQSQPVAFGVLSGALRRSTCYMVTMHGVMTWRLPSMRSRECVVAAYDRVLTLVEKVVPAQNRAWEKRRSPQLVVFNDQVHLRPATEGDLGLYVSQCSAKVARLVVEFGLEACCDGVRLVEAVMERATSDAAESAVLDAVVFGPPTDTVLSADGLEDPAPSPETLAANAAMVEVLAAFTPAATPTPSTIIFNIFSLLDRPTAGQCEGGGDDCNQSQWGSTLHTVSLDMLNAVVQVANTHHTAAVFQNGGRL